MCKTVPNERFHNSISVSVSLHRINRRMSQTEYNKKDFQFINEIMKRQVTFVLCSLFEYIISADVINSQTHQPLHHFPNSYVHLIHTDILYELWLQKISSFFFHNASIKQELCHNLCVLLKNVRVYERWIEYIGCYGREQTLFHLIFSVFRMSTMRI